MAELDAALVGKTQMKDVNLRTVRGGFVISLSVRYIDPETDQLVAQKQTEAVATTDAEITAIFTAFMADGSFPAA